jgi:hypothetical protein
VDLNNIKKEENTPPEYNIKYPDMEILMQAKVA